MLSAPKELKKKKQTVVFVSHDMSAVREYCDKVLLIDANEVVYIGEANKASELYSRLFIDKISDNNTQAQSSTKWGSGDIYVNKVNVRVKEAEILIVEELKSLKNIESLVYGLHILDSSGNELTAMNNKMILLPNIKGIERGSVLTISWSVQNIFNDGKYMITTTLVDDSGEVFDWHNEVASFEVKKAQRSTTSIIPPVRVEYKKIG